MKMFFVNNDLGASFASKSFHAPAIPAWALATGLGLSAGSALLNFFGNRSTNKTNTRNIQATNDANMQIAQETNAAERANLERQLSFNRESWALDNAYNSPSLQLARYRAAGISPHDAVSSGSSAAPAAGASANPLHTPQLSSPHVENELSALGAGFSDAITTAAAVQAMKDKSLDMEGKGIDLQTRSLKNLAELSSIRADIASKNAKSEFDRKNLEMLDQQIYQLRQSMPDLIKQAGLKSQEMELANSLLGKQIIEQEHDTLRRDAMNIQAIRSMDIDSAANWLNARSNAQHTDTELKRYKSDVHLALMNYKNDVQRVGIEKASMKLARDYFGLENNKWNTSKQVQDMQRQLLMLEVERLGQKNASWLGQALRAVFGVDLSDVAGAAAVGGAIKLAK